MIHIMTVLVLFKYLKMFGIVGKHNQVSVLKVLTLVKTLLKISNFPIPYKVIAQILTFMSK